MNVILLTRTKFLSDDWMLEHEFVEETEQQEKPRYVNIVD